MGRLVTLYEDRLRHSWARRCENGGRVNFEEEASKVNKEITNAYKIKLEAVLKNTGITAKHVPATPKSEVLRNADDEHAMALAKPQASIELSTRRTKATENALAQKEHAIDNKMEALKAAQSAAHQNHGGGKKRFLPNAGSGKGNKSWEHHKGQVKSGVNLEPNCNFHKGSSKGKSKSKFRYKIVTNGNPDSFSERRDWRRLQRFIASRHSSVVERHSV